MKGERDNQLGKVSLDNLARLKHSTTFIVPDAGHPSYVDNTPVFTREMIKFLLCMSSETQWWFEGHQIKLALYKVAVVKMFPVVTLVVKMNF